MITFQGVLPMTSNEKEGDSPTERDPPFDDLSIKSISATVEKKREHTQNVATVVWREESPKIENFVRYSERSVYIPLQKSKKLATPPMLNQRCQCARYSAIRSSTCSSFPIRFSPHSGISSWRWSVFELQVLQNILTQSISVVSQKRRRRGFRPNCRHTCAEKDLSFLNTIFIRFLTSLSENMDGLGKLAPLATISSFCSFNPSGVSDGTRQALKSKVGSLFLRAIVLPFRSIDT